MKAKKTTETYKHLCNLLDNHKKVYFSRFGDGDFWIMNGHKELLHDCTPELQSEMLEAFSIEDEQFLKGVMAVYELEEGMSNGVFAPPKEKDHKMIKDILQNKFNLPDDSVFENHVMFGYLSSFRQDLMVDFLNKYMRPKKKMVINYFTPEDHERGSWDHRSFDLSKTYREQELERIEAFLGPVDYFIEVPPRNAYSTIDEWWPKVLENIDDVELCLPFAGMAGRGVQKRLWNLNKEIHSIDLGSIIDAVTQRSTRTWMDRVGITVDELLIRKKQWWEG